MKREVLEELTSMAKKERQRRSARQERQQKRAEREAQKAAATDKGSGSSKKAARAKDGDTAAKKGGQSAKSTKTKKKGRIRSYFSGVRTELRRVQWPSRPELINYSVAAIVMLIIVGVVVYVVDLGFVNLFRFYTGLRG